MNRLALIIMFSLIPTIAMAVPVFPTEISGQYTVKFKTPPLLLDTDGLPLVAAIQSVSYEVVEDTAPDVGTEVILCQPMGDDETVQVSYTVQNNAIGRVAARATSYANADCTGLSSGMSNTAYHLFNGPLPVQILLSP